MIKIESPLVSVDWLRKNMNASNLIILDATITKVTAISAKNSDVSIKNTRFLDLKNEFSDTESQFPNTLLSPKKFEEAARTLGINSDTAIVVYDAVGIYSSARVWWMFKAMGHQNVAVLNGGFPAWINAGLSTEQQQYYSGVKGNFTVNFSKDYFYNYTDVLNAATEASKLILDARSVDRFNGTISEPRLGLRSGHIPNSLNLPYSKLQEHGMMKSKQELEIIFRKVNANQKKLIFSCGSGITACILALGAHLSGLQNCAVYDGSWTEWGTLNPE